MLNCKQAAALMSQGMDKELGMLQQMSLRFHLMMCGGCHNFKQQMGDLRAITRAYAKGENEQTENKG